MFVVVLSKITPMITFFECSVGDDAATLYSKYLAYVAEIEKLAVSPDFTQTFLSILNKAYDEALGETQEAIEAAKSPR